MARHVRVRTSKWAWGVALLLIAALILVNYFGGFVELGVWSIIVSAVALIILINCIARLSFVAIPLPIVALYYVFQAPLELPFIQFWLLAVVTVLVMCGLFFLLPRRYRIGKHFVVSIDGEGKSARSRRGKRGTKFGRNGNRCEDGIDTIIDDGDDEAIIEEGDDENNPYIRVQFGSASRYLRSDCLESAELDCSFGALEVYFDNVKLSPDGANIHVECSFGSIEIYLPGHWRVINELSASLGNAEVDRRLENADDDAPTVRITGDVSLGNVEVCRIKG